VVFELVHKKDQIRSCHLLPYLPRNSKRMMWSEPCASLEDGLGYIKDAEPARGVRASLGRYKVKK
jgi:hypothetical protein